MASISKIRVPVNGVMTTFDLKDASAAGGDWSVSQGEPGYIQNRTHYLDQVITEGGSVLDDYSLTIVGTAPQQVILFANNVTREKMMQLCPDPTNASVKIKVREPDGTIFEDILTMSQGPSGQTLIGNQNILIMMMPMDQQYTQWGFMLIKYKDIASSYHPMFQTTYKFNNDIEILSMNFVSIGSVLKKLDWQFMPFHDTVSGGEAFNITGTNDSVASGTKSHAEGYGTVASGVNSHAEGNGAIASGNNSHAEGSGQAIGAYAHAEGGIAKGNGSHTEGTGPSTGMQLRDSTGKYLKWPYSDAQEDFVVTSSGAAGAHAEGMATKVSAQAGHAEGINTKTSGVGAHAEGIYTVASGTGAHAEGGGMPQDGSSFAAMWTNQKDFYITTASGLCAHAQGMGTYAKGRSAHSQGEGTIANGSAGQHAQGKFNVEDTTGTYAHIVGGGSSDSDRKNIHTIDWSGNAVFAGDVTATKADGTTVSLLNLPTTGGATYTAGTGINISSSNEISITLPWAEDNSF